MVTGILQKNHRLILVLIPVLSFAMHYHVFRLDLVGIHVWRQTQTQTVINNFYTEDFNILNPRINARADTDRIFRMEFPLMQWVFALFYKIFGNHIIISRLLSFIIGLGTVYGIYYLGNRLFKNNTIAVLCAWAFNWSPLFYYYTINPLPDNMALCAATWSIGTFFAYADTGKIKYVIISALLLNIATLCKLPFILYGSVPAGYILIRFARKEINLLPAVGIKLVYLTMLLPAMAWYVYAIPSWQGNGIVKGILDSKESMSNILHYITGTLVSTLPELILNYGSVLFFLAGFGFLFQQKAYNNKLFPALIFISIAVTFYYLFEINMIQLVHDYYLFPFLPLVFIITGYGAYHMLQQNSKAVKTIATVALLVLPATAYLRADSRWDTARPGFNVVYYKNKEALRKIIPPDAKCIVGDDMSGYILLYYINRKGWTYFDGQLSEEQLTYYISKGAEYLFTDCAADTNNYVKQHINEKVFEKDNLRVYKLK